MAFHSHKLFHVRGGGELWCFAPPITPPPPPFSRPPARPPATPPPATLPQVAACVHYKAAQVLLHWRDATGGCLGLDAPPLQ